MLSFIRNVKRITKDAYLMCAYNTPAINPENILQTEEIIKLTKQFKKNGFLKFERDEFFNVAEYLDTAYFNKIEACSNSINVDDFKIENRKFSIKEFNKEAYLKGGMEISAYISFIDDALNPLMLDEKIHSILYAYYRRQHYFRNQPRIMKVDYKGKNTINNNNMHVDHLHQISIILNVSDITMNDTHTVYVPGSHRRSLLKDGIEMPVEKSKELVNAYTDREHFIGEKGTMYMFDTSGFHCGDYKQGNARKILHLNFTTGHNLTALYDDADELRAWSDKSGKPPCIRNSFNKAIMFSGRD